MAGWNTVNLKKKKERKKNADAYSSFHSFDGRKKRH